MTILFMALGVGCSDVAVELMSAKHPLMLREVRMVVEAQITCEERYPNKPCLKKIFFDGHTKEPTALCGEAEDKQQI